MTDPARVRDCDCTGGPQLPMGQHICFCQVRAMLGVGVLTKFLGLVPMDAAMIRFAPPPRPTAPPDGEAMRSVEV